jgi:hypothetical protein
MIPFRLAYPQVTPRLPFGAPGPEPAALTEKHRPKCLSEVVGQGAAVFQLQTFLEAPYAGAFLFEGPTGVGKTTAALALAAELGAVEFGGLDVIKSGTQDAEAVECSLRMLRFAPMLGSGWKVCVVDEADVMSPKAAQLWLSALEDLPPRSVIVFTTNHPEKFPDRFLDRCERVRCESDPELLAQDAQTLVNELWRAETGRDDAPPWDRLPNVVEKGQLSFRRVVRALEPIVRGLKWQAQPALARPAREPVPTGILDTPKVIEEPTTGGVEPREPCLDCDTRHGGLGSNGKIGRWKGRCQSCYNRFRRQTKVQAKGVA